MGLYIRDDRVRDMAKRLAEAQRITVTEAVRRRSSSELKELDHDRAERDRAIRQTGPARRHAACDSTRTTCTTSSAPRR